MDKIMRTITGAVLIFYAAYAAFSQSAPPAFDVASVKPAPPSPDHNLRVMMGGDAGRLNFSNVTLRNLMTRAYSIKDPQIAGPDWLKSERYDIVAKLPPNTPKEQIPLML